MTQTQPNSRSWLALLLLCTAQFMMVLDFSIVNVALSAIQTDLGFSQQNLQWLISAYGLTCGGFLLLGGRAADLFGRRRMFMAGIGVFTLGSIVGGFAQTEPSLIAARAFQGLGAAIVSPTALSILTTTFAEGSARNRALSIWGAIAAAGFGVGVLLGGILTDTLGWRSVMFINVPIGLLTLVLTPLLLQESKVQSAPQVDVLGAVTVTAGLMTLVYALQQASGAGWGSAQTIVLFGIAFALLAAFIWIEATVKSPLIPLRVFRLRTLTGANLIGLLMSGAIGSTIFILTLYMQQVLNYSALQTGLAFLPHAIAAIIAAAIATPAVARFGTKNTLIGSITLGAVGLLHLSQIPVRGDFVRDLLPGTVITGFSIVMVLVAVTIAATAGIADSEQGMASGLLTTSQEIGAALGLAILVAVSTARTQTVITQLGGAATAQKTALTAGFGAALGVTVGFAIAGMLVALFAIDETECRKHQARAARSALADNLRTQEKLDESN
jgi:EmrB/QacA subfamily drug resistance transporter